jgi:hypothetical protein
MISSADLPALGATLDDLHAAIVDGGWIQRQPDPQHTLERSPVEIGGVLVPGLLRSEEGRLEQRHVLDHPRLGAKELIQEWHQSGVSGDAPQPHVSGAEGPDLSDALLGVVQMRLDTTLLKEPKAPAAGTRASLPVQPPSDAGSVTSPLLKSTYSSVRSAA